MYSLISSYHPWQIYTKMKSALFLSSLEKNEVINFVSEAMTKVVMWIILFLPLGDTYFSTYIPKLSCLLCVMVLC
jgi:hypothetical protein